MENDQTPVFDVSGLIASVNQTLEFSYPVIMVEGEVSSFKVSQGKWVFFDLKDNSGSVSCFMSIYNLRTEITDGMTVVVRASLKLTDWGKFSLTIQTIKPKGEGSLKKSFDLLLQKLEKEGLFTPERKRLIVEMPKHIGLISSTGAAGYVDFMKILDKRWAGIKVDVANVQVQGYQARDQIIRAIRYFNSRELLPEVLVIVRGGGSIDDLSTFNDELLVREIAASRIPTLVGVGHEIDVTLADMAADVRAATPSEAAEILVPDKKEIITRLGLYLGQAIERYNYRLDDVSDELLSRLSGIIVKLENNVDEMDDRLSATASVMNAVSPWAVLRRGYAIVRGEEQVGQTIQIEKLDKLISAEVKNVKAR